MRKEESEEDCYSLLYSHHYRKHMDMNTDDLLDVACVFTNKLQKPKVKTFYPNPDMVNIISDIKVIELK